MATLAEERSVTLLAHLSSFLENKAVVVLLPIQCMPHMAFSTQRRGVADEACPRILLCFGAVSLKPKVFGFVRRRFFAVTVLAEGQAVFVARHALFCIFKGKLAVFDDPVFSGVLYSPRKHPRTVAHFALSRGDDLGEIRFCMAESVFSCVAESTIRLKVHGLHGRFLAQATELTVAVLAETDIYQVDLLAIRFLAQADSVMAVIAGKVHQRGSQVNAVKW